jgi:hypothetical protein
MSDEACGLWVDVWTSILVEELPRLGRAIASIEALEPEYLTDSKRRHVKDMGAMLLSRASLETLQSVAENVLYQQMLAMRSAFERIPGEQLKKSNASWPQRGRE